MLDSRLERMEDIADHFRQSVREARTIVKHAAVVTACLTLSLLLVLLRELARGSLLLQVLILAGVLGVGWYGFLQPMGHFEVAAVRQACNKVIAKVGLSPVVGAAPINSQAHANGDPPPLHLGSTVDAPMIRSAVDSAMGYLTPTASTRSVPMTSGSHAGGMADSGGLPAGGGDGGGAGRGAGLPPSSASSAALSAGASGPGIRPQGYGGIPDVALPSLDFQLGSRQFLVRSGRIFMSQRGGASSDRLKHMKVDSRRQRSLVLSQLNASDEYDDITAGAPLVVGTPCAATVFQKRYIFYRTVTGAIIMLCRKFTNWAVTNLSSALNFDSTSDVAVTDLICRATASSLHVYFVGPPLEGGHVHELYINNIWSWAWRHSILTLSQQKKFLVAINAAAAVSLPAVVTKGDGVVETGATGASVGAAAGAGAGSSSSSSSGVPYLPQLLEFDGNGNNCLRYMAAGGRKCRLQRRGMGGLWGWKFSLM